MPLGWSRPAPHTLEIIDFLVCSNAGIQAHKAGVSSWSVLKLVVCLLECSKEKKTKEKRRLGPSLASSDYPKDVGREVVITEAPTQKRRKKKKQNYKNKVISFALVRLSLDTRAGTHTHTTHELEMSGALRNAKLVSGPRIRSERSVYIYIYIYIYKNIRIISAGPSERVPPGCGAHCTVNSQTVNFLSLIISLSVSC